MFFTAHISNRYAINPNTHGHHLGIFLGGQTNCKIICTLFDTQNSARNYLTLATNHYWFLLEKKFSLYQTLRRALSFQIYFRPAVAPSPPVDAYTFTDSVCIYGRRRLYSLFLGRFGAVVVVLNEEWGRSKLLPPLP